MSRKALRCAWAVAAALVVGPAIGQAQDEEEAPLIAPDRLALLRGEKLPSPEELTATPERLFLGNCSSCHGTGKLGDGDPARLTQVILHGVHRGVPGNVSMPGFAAAMTDEQVAGLVAHLAEATTGRPAEVAAEAVGRARAGQQAILKPMND